MPFHFSGLQRTLLVFVILSLSACKLGEIKNPEVSVTSSRFTPVNLKYGVLENQLRVSNPNVFKLPVKTVSYKLFLNGKEFTHGKTQHSLKIPAGGNQMVSLPLDISYENLISGVGSIFTNKAIRFQLKGEIDFGLISVPYSKTGEFTLK